MESQATEKGMDREFVKLKSRYQKYNTGTRKLAFLMYSFLIILKIKIGFNRKDI